jgi:DNA-binding response OmpR family regulator
MEIPVKTESERKKILVVDDEADIVTTLGMRLESEGYEVATAGDGMRAVAATQRETPDLIILDIRMPAGTGYDVYTTLQASSTMSKIPVIFVSALSSEEVRRKVTELGGAHFLPKPFDTEELLALIKKLLADKQD